MIQEYNKIKKDDSYDIFFEKRPDFCNDLENELYGNDDYICINGNCEHTIGSHEYYSKKKEICDKEENLKDILNKWVENLPFIYNDEMTTHREYKTSNGKMLEIIASYNDYYDFYRFFEKTCFYDIYESTNVL